MSDAKPPPKPAASPPVRPRTARQAEALKRNLKRRKAAQKQGDKD